MKKLLFVLPAIVLLAAGCNSASSTSSSSSSPPSREKAAGIILSYMKQSSSKIGVPMHQKFPIGIIDNGGISCGDVYPIYNPDTASALINEGYLSKTAVFAMQDRYAPTAKANPFITTEGPYSDTLSYSTAVPANPNDIVLLAQLMKVDVTGITQQGNTMKADFTETSQLTPFGVACSYPTTQNGFADFQLYDDGWRIVDVNLVP